MSDPSNPWYGEAFRILKAIHTKPPAVALELLAASLASAEIQGQLAATTYAVDVVKAAPTTAVIQ